MQPGFLVMVSSFEFLNMISEERPGIVLHGGELHAVYGVKCRVGLQMDPKPLQLAPLVRPAIEL